ncbi:MAG: carboxymuconolactone decarboxylase family protein [Chloroflexi bacterium]|nr:carboxymuconolactone decarboxylase family protein [Chloroflexota bacterium]
MPRVPYVAREDLPPEQRRLYDDISRGREFVATPFKALLNSPEACAIVSDMARYVRGRSSLPAPLRELTILAVAREIDCQYEWSLHEPLARQAGASDAAIEALRDRRPLKGLPSDEVAVARYARSLVRRHHVSDALFRTLQKRLGTRGIVDLTVTVGHYTSVGLSMKALEVDLEPGMEPLLPA